jgi:hypothetical protein
MKTLVLYHNDNGEAQQCIVTHAERDELIDYPLEELLPNYNAGGGAFVLPLDSNVSEDFIDRPDVFDSAGDEVPCYFVGLD